jgi:voltage-gated potassium channel
MDANIPEQTALIIIAVKENDNATDEILFNLTKEYMLKPGQTLIFLGEDAHLNRLLNTLNDHW